MTDDGKLNRRLRQGDKKALAEIYGEHKDRLLSLAYHLIGDRSAAEDCLQDVFLKLTRDAVGLRIRGNLRAYLSSCVLNRARDILKKERRNVHAPSAAGGEHEASGPDPSVEAEGRYEAARIQRAIALLPAEQREVVALHLHTGLTFRLIAKLQLVSINTAQSRYRYGIQKLRELLA